MELVAGGLHEDQGLRRDPNEGPEAQGKLTMPYHRLLAVVVDRLLTVAGGVLRGRGVLVRSTVRVDQHARLATLLR